jgi:hypothetical protein
MKTLDKDRVIAGGTIGSFDFVRFNSMGLTPFYYDRNKDGSCSLVEVNHKNLSLVERKRVFLLFPDEYCKIGEFIGNLNALVILNQKKIDLLNEMVIPILVGKIMV